MIKYTQYLICTIIIAFLMSSCASLTGFEEGRTLGAENSEIGVSLNYVKAPNLFDDESSSSDDLDNIGFPNIELNYKYGVTNKLDVGGKISTNLNGSTYAKYQVVGDNSSKFALSPGLEIGTILGSAYSIGIPIYTSIYPTDNVTININPRFMYQFVSAGPTEGATYIGGNFGLMFGKKNKFGIDIGYYNVGVVGENQALLTFGFGGKFRFGDFDTGSSKSSRKRR
ncbi:MAG: hypothetical protein ACJA1A_001219 [Saprospiraceae bacterium]|jgi:hypothetical protein